MRWTKELVAEIGPGEADGKKIFAAAKKGDVEKVRSLLLDCGLNFQLGEALVAAVKAIPECERTIEAAKGCDVTKRAADRLVGAIRGYQPTSLDEAVKVCDKLEEVSREGSAANHKLQLAVIAECQIDGLHQRFGWALGKGPCRPMAQSIPESVRAALLKIGIGEWVYPFSTEHSEFMDRPQREVRSVIEAMREDFHQAGSPDDQPQSGNAGYFSNARKGK